MKIGDFIHVPEDPAAAPAQKQPPKDLRFYRFGRTSPLRVMCPNCREGGLRTTYGDDQLSGCSNCGGKWSRKDLDRYNDQLLIDYEIRKVDPDGGPVKEWLDRMKKRRGELIAERAQAKREQQARHQHTIRQMQERNALSRAGSTA